MRVEHTYEHEADTGDHTTLEDLKRQRPDLSSLMMPVTIEGPSIRDLLSKVEQQLCVFQGSRLWVEYPYAAINHKDFREILFEYHALDPLLISLGAKLVGELAAEQGWSEEHSRNFFYNVGRILVDDYCSDLIRKHYQELQLIRGGRWKELHEQGLLNEDDYRELSKEFPDGNPWHKGKEAG